MKGTILRSRRGETLVEVTCAGLLIVLALGGLLGAVRFAGSVEKRSQRVAEQILQLQQSLRGGAQPGPAAGTADYRFTECSPDDPGEETLFTVTASLESKNACYEAEDGEERTVTFRLFACPEEGGTP